MAASPGLHWPQGAGAARAGSGSQTRRLLSCERRHCCFPSPWLAMDAVCSPEHSLRECQAESPSPALELCGPSNTPVTGVGHEKLPTLSCASSWCAVSTASRPFSLVCLKQGFCSCGPWASGLCTTCLWGPTIPVRSQRHRALRQSPEAWPCPSGSGSAGLGGARVLVPRARDHTLRPLVQGLLTRGRSCGFAESRR